jgi:hypothetical protein
MRNSSYPPFGGDYLGFVKVNIALVKGGLQTHHVDPIGAIPFPAFTSKFDPQTEKLVYSNMTKATTSGLQSVLQIYSRPFDFPLDIRPARFYSSKHVEL